MKAPFREIQEWMRRIGVSNAAQLGVEYVPSVQPVESVADSSLLVTPVLGPMAWSGGVLPSSVVVAFELYARAPTWVRSCAVSSSLAQVFRWGVLTGSTGAGLIGATVCTNRNMTTEPTVNVLTLGDATALQRLTVTDAARIIPNNSWFEIDNSDSRVIYLLPGNVFWCESAVVTGLSGAQFSICWSEVPS